MRHPSLHGKKRMVPIDMTSSATQAGREPDRDLTTRIRRMSIEINRALAAAKPEATVEQLTNRICRIIRRHGLDPNRATVRRKVKDRLALRAEVAAAIVDPTIEVPIVIPRQPVFAELPELEVGQHADAGPTFAPLPAFDTTDG
jgi:hypothetical protein